jgi:hypothetical protein
MCPKCEAFAERLTFRTPADYIAFAGRLIGEMRNGRFTLVYGDCALEALLNAPPWPTGDGILHEVQCSQCGQFFQLFVNVWNGRNLWEPQTAEEWAKEGIAT